MPSLRAAIYSPNGDRANMFMTFTTFMLFPLFGTWNLFLFRSFTRANSGIRFVDLLANIAVLARHRSLYFVVAGHFVDPYAIRTLEPHCSSTRVRPTPVREPKQCQYVAHLSFIEPRRLAA